MIGTPPWLAVRMFCMHAIVAGIINFFLCFTVFYVDIHVFSKLAWPHSNRNLQSHMNVQYKPQEIGPGYTQISLFIYLLTDSMEQNPSASQEIPHILWKPKVHYHI
jgi:hypothetical protein